MAERREVRILVGKRNYRMQTDLDEVTLSRVLAIVNEVGDAMGSGVDQDSLLMLTCLQLAYNLEKVSRTLGPLLGKLNALPSWEPLPEDEEER